MVFTVLDTQYVSVYQTCFLNLVLKFSINFSVWLFTLDLTFCFVCNLCWIYLNYTLEGLSACVNTHVHARLLTVSKAIPLFYKEKFKSNADQFKTFAADNKHHFIWIVRSR